MILSATDLAAGGLKVGGESPSSAGEIDLVVDFTIMFFREDYPNCLVRVGGFGLFFGLECYLVNGLEVC